LAAHKNGFAFMPQRDALMPWRRIIDNLTLGLEVQGIARQDARAQVMPLVADFGLEGFTNHYPAQLSGGMRQRTALLRTIVQGRAVQLLDEPFGALDALTRTQMQTWFEARWQTARWTTLLVNDVREAVVLSAYSFFARSVGFEITALHSGRGFAPLCARHAITTSCSYFTKPETHHETHLNCRIHCVVFPPQRRKS
jgi:ABC-type nitrate/sulfonate/bicarbonate transport system ATPase subunit